MTNLKVKYADEIAENMFKALENDEFMGVFKKEAALKEAEKEEECLSGDCGDAMMADDKCEACDMVEDQCMCEKDSIAAEFALNHLVKIADALDSKGFESFANMIDETMDKIAKKKEKADKKKEEKEEEENEEEECEEKEDKKKDKKKDKKDKKKGKKEKKDDKKKKEDDEECDE